MKSRQGRDRGLSITFNLQVMWREWTKKSREDPSMKEFIEEKARLIQEMIDLKTNLTASELREQALKEDISRLQRKLEESRKKQHLYKEEYKLQLDKAFQDVYAMSEFLKKIESRVAPCCEACTKNDTTKRKRVKKQSV